ncbi:hypothetical protein [Bradyrhizobium diversitatis]|uniref:Uncharacterized protein n=1 Tax=Bradyrhizobium diversitatis TaxID=2755406 RepID=A0ABS0P6J7_9BRAD|nr:hypothetical protein [Bradyrhizobium diversitatis]MBH5388910.1 hypothetical protein [Bradyrhizobium diversitatis]
MMMSDCAALVTHFRAVRPGSFGNAAERTARAIDSGSFTKAENARAGCIAKRRDDRAWFLPTKNLKCRIPPASGVKKKQ